MPRRRGRFYLVAFFYLASMMLLWTVPRLVLRDPVIPDPVTVFAQWLLPLSLLALVFLPFDPRDDDTRQVFDFFYAVLLFQLVVVLVLGSVALMRYTGGEYFQAAGLTVIGFGATLFVLAVFWGPREGFGGLQNVPVPLPAVGRHAVRDLGAAGRGAGRAGAGPAALPRAGPRPRVGAALGARRQVEDGVRAKASSARRRRTS